MNRRNKIKTVLTFAVVAIAMVAMATSANAAELTDSGSTWIYWSKENSEGNYGYNDFPISVYPGKTYYAGTGAGGDVSGDFNGTSGYMFAYRFFNADASGLITIAQSDPNLGGYGLVSPATAVAVNGNQGNWGKLWTVSDPDVNEPDFAQAGFAKTNSATGTINISRLSSGVVYFIYGGYRSGISVDLTMSGAGQPDVTIVKGGYDWCQNNEALIARFDFTDVEDYDTITYTYFCRKSNGVDLEAAGRGRFMGVIIDGIDKYAPSMTMVDKATWSGEAVQLSPGVANNDPNSNDLEFAWTAEPADGVVFSDPTIENPTVTINKDATGDVTPVTITLAANNVGSQAATDSLTINVYDDACEMAKAITPAAADQVTDFNKNCVTGIDDIAIMAAVWLADYTALEAFAKP